MEGVNINIAKTTTISATTLSNHTNNSTSGYTGSAPGPLLYASLIFYLCIAFVCIVGNALVIYASYGNNNRGPLRYLDDLVKSLAVTDLLFGLFGVPCVIYLSYLSELYFLKDK